MWTLKNNPLTLIVDPNIQALAQLQEELPREWEAVSIGRELSSFLISQKVTNYTQIIHKWLDGQLREKAPGPVICIDIDILFYPFFNLDPLTLFRQISRHTRLIILWPGEYKDGILSYAQPEHKHYRYWKNLEGLEIKGVSDALQ
jgi:hypothetical protein